MMGKIIRIPIHSFVDVITNSSTTIFVQVHDNTIQYAKDLINAFLEMAKSDKTADDLFEFKVVPNSACLDIWVDEKIDAWIDETNFERYYQGENGHEHSYWDDPKYKTKHNELKAEFYKYAEENPAEEIGTHDYGWDMHDLILTPKDNTEEMNLTARIESMFELDGARDM